MRSMPLAYMFGSPVVPCFVEIGSIRLHFLNSLAMLPALLLKATFTSILIMTWWFSVFSLVMNISR